MTVFSGIVLKVYFEVIEKIVAASFAPERKLVLETVLIALISYAIGHCHS